MLNKILAAVAGIIASIILIVTVTTFIVRGCSSTSSEKKSGSRKNTPSIFELGQIRIALKPEDATSVAVVEPCLSFSKENNSLYEELLQKQLKIKEEISMHISQFSREDLKSKGEMLIKDELVDRINSLLVMGRIDSIYFKKFIYID